MSTVLISSDYGKDKTASENNSYPFKQENSGFGPFIPNPGYDGPKRSNPGKGMATNNSRVQDKKRTKGEKLIEKPISASGYWTIGKKGKPKWVNTMPEYGPKESGKFMTPEEADKLATFQKAHPSRWQPTSKKELHKKQYQMNIDPNRSENK